jgi:methionyl-tRNA synthetase
MKFYVTTSIPYVNAEPHLGHGMEFVMADVLARNSRQLGQETILSIGSDEHGGKVAKKAKEKGLEPKAFTDELSQKFRDLAKDLNISNDKFIRTTDPEHEKRSQQIWTALSNDIYKKKYVGWYCTGDEAFFTEAVVKANNGICPAHNIPYEKVEEENYFFRLSKYNEEIKDAIKTDKLRIIPKTRKNEILNVIEDGLDDISISRPKDKISWGIAVPGDDTQVIYVWFEALLNYITVLGYPEGQEFKDFWPANYQVIGKDILRFHAAIWPGILLALKLPIEKNLYAHGFINVDNQKMSKSIGNVVAPKDIVDRYSSDAFRYFFLRHIPSYEDGDFTWQKFHEAYQNELGNELGNAVQRTVAMIVSYEDGKFEKTSKQLTPEVKAAIDECHFDRALELIWDKVRGLNQYIDERKPWTLHKEGNIEELRTVLNSQVDQILGINEDLKAFLPHTTERIEKLFEGDTVAVLPEVLFPRVDLPA